jgi:8-oxo-dGTP pyrophosphatase MutT (NUDIX family)
MKLYELYSLSEKADPNRTKNTAWVILHNGNKIILGKRSPSSNNPNQWNFFGGHVDKGESPKDAAVRELEEETGFKIDPSSLKQIAEIGTATYFSAKVTNASEVLPSSEISAVKSYKLTDLPDNLHSKTQTFFTNLDELLS